MIFLHFPVDKRDIIVYNLVQCQKRKKGRIVSMVYDKVIDIVANQFDVEREELSAETDFVDDLRADSLDVVELIMALEDEFEIEVPDDQMESVRTVGDVVSYLEDIVE